MRLSGRAGIRKELTAKSSCLRPFASLYQLADLSFDQVTFERAQLVLYLLCFEHVDNLGAYSIPSETGLLIPSDIANYNTNCSNRGYLDR